MQTWAADRVHEHCPFLPPGTVNFLLRAEARTVSSVMNARSGIQVIEVVEAALRRAGLRREWFLRPSGEEGSEEMRAAFERQATASASLMTAVASQPSNDQVVVLLLSLQNQLAGQWQAINALSASVIQLRHFLGPTQQDHLQQGMQMMEPHQAASGNRADGGAGQHANMQQVQHERDEVGEPHLDAPPTDSGLQHVAPPEHQNEGADHHATAQEVPPSEATTEIFSQPNLEEEPQAMQQVNGDEDPPPNTAFQRAALKC